MLLPGDPRERHALFRNLVRDCERDRDDRKAETRRLRNLYLTGSDTVERAKENRLKEHVADITADLYSHANVRFGITYPPHRADRWLAECEALRDELHRLWHDSKIGLTFGQQVEWANVYRTSLGKVFVDRGEVTYELIPDPADVAVCEQRVDDWDKQESLVHWYDLNLSAFRRLITVVQDPDRRASIWAQANEHAAPSGAFGSDSLGPAMSRMILSTASPTMVGTANMTGRRPADPNDKEPVARLAELWVFDDEATLLCGECGKPDYDLAHVETYRRIANPFFDHKFIGGGGAEGDYRVVTLLESSMDMPVIKEPLNPLDHGHHPFHDLTLNPTPGYIYGVSPLDDIVDLQLWGEQAEANLNEAIDRNLDPAIIGLGVSGVAEEKLAKLKRKGSTAAFAVSGAGMDVKPFTIPIPTEAEQRPTRIAQMFDRAAGRRQRQREPGQRSGDQVLQEAMLQGGPTLNKAMLVEAAAGDVATALMRIKRRVSKTSLYKYDEETQKYVEFYMMQMPSDFVARVDGHSGSPLFQQQNLAKVAFAAAQKWLDPDEGIELLRLPNSEALKIKARRRAIAAAKQGEKGISLKERDTKAKEIRAAAALESAEKK